MQGHHYCKFVLVFRLSHHARLQALAQDARLLMKIAAKTSVLVNAAVQKQHGHRHILRDAVRAFGIVSMDGDGVYLIAQELQCIVIKAFGQGMQLTRLLDKILAALCVITL